MAMVRRAGDSMIFRQNTSTPGGTVWTVEAHSIAQNFPITIVAHVTVAITGANQALFSLGTAAARMLEVGVDATGRPYAWGSGAQVLLGAALTAGSHVLAFIVAANGTVKLLADAEYLGAGTVVMGTAVSRACAGVSCLGTLPWSGTYSDVRVYASEEEGAAIGAMGLVGTRTVWTPEKLVQPGDSWLLTDLDGAGGVTTQPQPVALDAACEDVTKWTPGNGGTLTNVGGGVAGNCMRVAFNGTANPAAHQNVVIVGNRYLGLSAWAKSDGAAVPNVYIDAPGSNSGTTSTSWHQVIVPEYTASSVTLRLRAIVSAAGYCEFDSVSPGKNLSINQLTCKGTLGNLAQATAANMQWSSDADAPTSVRLNTKRVIYSDGVADHSVSSEAAAAHEYHKADGFTYCEVVRATDAAAKVLISTGQVATDHGIVVIVDGANTRIQVYVFNGTGVASIYVVSGAGSFPLNTWNRLAVTWSEAAGAILCINDAAPITQATAVAASANDATTTLNYGRRAGGGFFGGGRTGFFLKTGAQTSDNLGKWRAWAKAYYAL